MQSFRQNTTCKALGKVFGKTQHAKLWAKFSTKHNRQIFWGKVFDKTQHAEFCPNKVFCPDDDDNDDDDTGGSVLCAVQVWVWQVSGQQPVTSCRLCERRPSSCRRIAGLYTVTVLTKGTYNPVVEIPPEACGINMTELAPSQNYLGQCP